MTFMMSEMLARNPSVRPTAVDVGQRLEIWKMAVTEGTAATIADGECRMRSLKRLFAQASRSSRRILMVVGVVMACAVMSAVLIDLATATKDDLHFSRPRALRAFGRLIVHCVAQQFVYVSGFIIFALVLDILYSARKPENYHYKMFWIILRRNVPTAVDLQLKWMITSIILTITMIFLKAEGNQARFALMHYFVGRDIEPIEKEIGRIIRIIVFSKLILRIVEIFEVKTKMIETFLLSFCFNILNDI